MTPNEHMDAPIWFAFINTVSIVSDRIDRLSTISRKYGERANVYGPGNGPSVIIIFRSSQSDANSLSSDSGIAIRRLISHSAVSAFWRGVRVDFDFVFFAAVIGRPPRLRQPPNPGYKDFPHRSPV